MNLKRIVTAGSLATSLLTLTMSPAFADNPFADVPANSWAYDAIDQLAADGLIQGYPNKTFNGKRPLTRYEAAVLTQRAVKKLEAKIDAELSDAATAQAVRQRDIDAVKKLVDEYGDEIKGLKTDVAQLEADDATTKKTLARSQLHVYYFLRAPGTLNLKVAANAAPGVPIASGVKLPPWGANAGQGDGPWSNTQTGSSSFGTGYEDARLFFKGDVDNNVSYGIRVEDRFYMVNGSGVSATSPQIGANSNFPSNGLLKVNLAYVTYNDRRLGVDLTGGRYGYNEGPDDLGLNYSDYFDGGAIHFNSLRGGPAAGEVQDGFDANVGFGANQSANSNATLSPGVATNQQQSFFASTAYTLAKQFNVGFSYISDSGFFDQSLFNSITGVYTPTSTRISTGSAWLQATFNPNLKLEIEALHRFGNDPFTKTHWLQPNAYWTQLNVGDSIGHKGNNLAQLGYLLTGFNSTGAHTNVVGTTGYQQFYVQDPNGNQIEYVSLAHWVSSNVRIGVVYQHYGNSPGTNQPIAGSAYVSGFSGNAITLETLVAF